MAIRIIKIKGTDREMAVVDKLSRAIDVDKLCRDALLSEAANRGIVQQETAVEKANRLLDEGKEAEASAALLDALKSSRAKKDKPEEKKE